MKQLIQSSVTTIIGTSEQTDIHQNAGDYMDGNKPSFTSIDEYIATFPAIVQEKLEQMRTTIRAAVPVRGGEDQLSDAHVHTEGQSGALCCSPKAHRVLPYAQRHRGVQRRAFILQRRQGVRPIPAGRTAAAGSGGAGSSNSGSLKTWARPGAGSQTVSWQLLEEQQRELAAFGVERLNGKVAYLATVRRDGSPRRASHDADHRTGPPVRVHGTDLAQGPRLRRDGRYASMAR